MYAVHRLQLCVAGLHQEGREKAGIHTVHSLPLTQDLVACQTGNETRRDPPVSGMEADLLGARHTVPSHPSCPTYHSLGTVGTDLLVWPKVSASRCVHATLEFFFRNRKMATIYSGERENKSCDKYVHTYIRVRRVRAQHVADAMVFFPA